MKSIQRLLLNARLLRIALFLAVGLAVLWMILSPRPPYPGNPAPNMTIYSLSKGIPYDLHAFKGRWIMVNFWTSWCPPCREEFPSMIRLWQDFRDDENWAFLWVNVAETEGDLRKFLNSVVGPFQINPDDLPVFLDPQGESRNRFGVWKYPETFIIDPSGKIVSRIIGPQQWDHPRWRERFRTRDFFPS